MSKRKDAPAFFEVMGRKAKAEASQAVPGWINKPVQPTQGAPATAGEPPSVPPAPVAPAMDTGAAELPLGREGNLFRVTMPLGGWAIAAGVMVLLLVGTFVLGRVTAHPAGPDVKAPQDLAADGSDKGNNGGTVTPGSSQKKKYCMVIQKMFGKTEEQKQEGLKIVEFLTAPPNNIKCGLFDDGDEYIVWSTEPFDDFSKGSKGWDYAKKVEDLGKQYKHSGGKYDFAWSPHADHKPMVLPARN